MKPKTTLTLGVTTLVCAFLNLNAGTTFALTQEPVATQEVSNVDQSTSLLVQVVNKDDNPVDSAKVEIRNWTGTWEPTEFKGTTDQQGETKFTGVEPDRYSTVLVTHPEFASSLSDFTINSGEMRTLRVKLLPAIQNSIMIKSPEGIPIAGAEISRLEISSSGSNSRTFLNCDMFPMLTGKEKSEFKSDPSGRLKLPPIPANSNVKITVVHPDWASGETMEIEAGGGELTTVMLNRGTKVQINFVGNQEALDAIRGKEIAVQTFTNSGVAGSDDSSLNHRILSLDNQLKFCIPPGQYDAFYLNAPDVFITPSIPSSPTSSKFNDFRAERIEKNCVVRKMKKVRGRVVTIDGKPVAGAAVRVETQNLFADNNQKLVPLETFGWALAEVAETDQDGYYSAQAPYGKVQLDAQWSDYYSDPAEITFEHNGKDAVPDFVVRPFPTITGTIQNSSGASVESAVVRILGAGETSYVTTDKAGKFSIQLKRFEYDLKLKKRKFESTLLVFDPGSDEANLIQVGLKSPEEYENIRIDLSPRSSAWLEDKIAERNQPNMAGFSPEMIKRIEALQEQSRIKFAEGTPGNRVPDLEFGTWFNTDAKSLEDLRGKFVLLDFWFIGCGPCERDFPSVKLAHELFARKGFTVLSIHIATQSPENVKQYCDAKGLDFPLVVEGSGGEFLKAFKKVGVEGFPSYLLIGPDGKIIHNDQVHSPEQKHGMSLRTHKLELIRNAIQGAEK